LAPQLFHSVLSQMGQSYAERDGDTDRDTDGDTDRGTDTDRDSSSSVYRQHPSDTEAPQLCNPEWTEWPKHVVIFTNFEISQAALWQSPLCRAFFDTVERDSRQAQYGDAALHTLCVLISLSKAQYRKLADVIYEGHLPPTPTAHTATNATTSHNSHGLNLPATATATASATASASASAAKYRLTSLAELDALFEPQRLGWLGGDVAASVLLPLPSDSTAGPQRGSEGGGGGYGREGGVIERHVWLFGDSLVGTSSASVRLEGVLVSNSFAVATRWALGLGLGRGWGLGLGLGLGPGLGLGLGPELSTHLIPLDPPQA